MPGTERNVLQSLESIKKNIDFLARNWNNIKSFLSA